MQISDDRKRHARELVVGDGWIGVNHIRVLTLAKGDYAAARATGGELADGAFLPEKWGGPGTTTVDTPMLQEIRDQQQRGGGMLEITTVWLELNTE
jgi:hypothetical protein